MLPTYLIILVGNIKIKEHPEIFLEPLVPQQKDPKNTNTDQLPDHDPDQDQGHDQLNPTSDSSHHDHEIHEPVQSPVHVPLHPGAPVHIPEYGPPIHIPGYLSKHAFDNHNNNHHISDDQVAAAVDAAIKTVPGPDEDCYDAAAAAETVDSVMNMGV